MNASLLHLRRIVLLLLLVTACFTAKAAETNSSPEAPQIFGATNAPSTSFDRPAATNQTPALQLNNSLSDVTGSMVRVFGALALVLGIFLGGVWLFRNWQRLTIHRGKVPKLNVFETRSLGGRHAIYVVGYENERFLISSSPAGINMLTHLQPADEPAETENTGAPQPTFAQALVEKLKGK